MTKNKKVIPIYIIACCILISFTAATAAITPREAIKSTIESILDTLKDKNQSDKEKEKRNKIKGLIKDRFDFKEMAKRSLARHWKKRAAKEKKEFISIFSELLVSSYMGKIEAFTDEKITYDKEVIKGGSKYSVVKTTIVTKDVDIPIDYKLILKDGKWWVYDVVIEEVSFISTYRNQYNKIIVKKSYEELVKRMKSKLDEVNALIEKGPSAKNEER